MTSVSADELNGEILVLSLFSHVVLLHSLTHWILLCFFLVRTNEECTVREGMSVR